MFFVYQLPFLTDRANCFDDTEQNVHRLTGKEKVSLFFIQVVLTDIKTLKSHCFFFKLLTVTAYLMSGKSRSSPEVFSIYSRSPELKLSLGPTYLTRLDFLTQKRACGYSTGCE